MVLRARLYIAIVVLAGALSIATADWQLSQLWRFVCYLLICAVASGLKVKVPDTMGTMSVNFLFILIGILEMSSGETILLGCSGAVVQCFWRARKPVTAAQALFSIMDIAVAIRGAYYVYHAGIVQALSSGSPLALIVSALVYFVLNTIGVAGVIAITEAKPFSHVWRTCYFWSFPFYLMGASIAWIFSLVRQYGQAHGVLLLVPIIYFIYRSYTLYLAHLKEEQRHVANMAALHLRTIEALALAIDAKDHTTHQHLSRVCTYAIEIGRELGLSQAELDGLRAGALLHDIGKLAVPEHILSKPGKLTPEEFEKMKVHPIVGAEILERVEFPYPVVPIVRSHHEKWDGTGYPDGLQGESIPPGARILAAVDCLDALASDRQYRKALPLSEAMKEVSNQAGKSFDPTVVRILERRYMALEELAKKESTRVSQLCSTDVRIERGAPGAGFEVAQPSAGMPARRCEFISSIAAARQEVQDLFELTQELGSSLSVDETLSVVTARLKRMISYDAIAVYVCRDGRLLPEYVNGESFRTLSTMELTIGQGISGWVAQTGRPILNGQCTAFPSFRSALAAPLTGLNGIVGVMTLYRVDKDSFSADQLRILLAITSKVSLTIETALRFRQVETNAITDYLTELPNARSLFLRLDSDLGRCKRLNEPLTVMVSDLDGFKVINDVHGHLIGNKVLRAIGVALREHCREYDYVARMGGDEFVLILPGCDREATRRRIAELSRIGACASAVIHGMEHLTLSIGEAFFPEDGTDAEQLLAVADRRMYRSKQQTKRELSQAAPVLSAEYVSVQ